MNVFRRHRSESIQANIQTLASGVHVRPLSTIMHVTC